MAREINPLLSRFPNWTGDALSQKQSLILYVAIGKAYFIAPSTSKGMDPFARMCARNMLLETVHPKLGRLLYPNPHIFERVIKSQPDNFGIDFDKIIFSTSGDSVIRNGSFLEIMTRVMVQPDLHRLSFLPRLKILQPE